MPRYSKSFLFSLLIHLVLAVVLFFSYKQVSEYLHEQKHDCSCCSTTINLSAIQTQKKQSEQKVVEKPEQIKKVIEKPKELKPKKIEKKKPIKKLEKMIKVPLKPKEPVKEVVEEIPEEVVIEQNTTQIATQNSLSMAAEKHCQTEVVTPEKNPQQKADDYLSSHVAKIVAMLKENLYYPRRARKKGIEGVVKIKFTLSTDAKISNVEVVESKYEILSRAAVETIENLEGKLPYPSEELTLTIPINYDLK